MTKRLVILITVSILVTFSGYKMTSQDRYKNAEVAHFVNQNENKPVFTNLDFEIISNAKIQIQKKNNRFLPAYKKLLKNADQALLEGPFSVVNKTQIPVSGDKHDYLSLGPYWWPDPEKTDGLPWIRRDGEINPLTRGENVDEPRKDKMFANTYKLGLAYFFSDDKKYKKKAIELLKVWFINSDTKMNPNLNYAQGLPGTNNGRGIGIIEFTGITNIITTIEILEYKNAIDKITSQQLRSWFLAYLIWLDTSENGIFERNTKNNHATWYDVQHVSILRFLNLENDAKKVLENVKTARIATQISEDGKQPHELARTKSLSYSLMNLKAFTILAYHGEKLGVDLWNYKPNGAGGIKDAYNFLYPYANGTKKWELQQLGSVEKETERLKNLFVFAGSVFNNVEYCQLHPKNKNDDLDVLLFSCGDQN